MHGVCSRCDMCPVRHQGVCHALDDDELTKLARVSRRRQVKAHRTIFAEGDDANHYFNVVQGIVKLVKTFATGDQHIIGLVYPPEFLGEPLNVRHSYSAETATDVELCSFPRGQFEVMLEENSDLKQALFKVTLRELDICRNWTLLLSRKSSYERVASFLYMFASRVPILGCVPHTTGQIQMHLPFTRAEIADYLGLTLETVSRQLSRLKAKKVIELPTSRDIVVPDLELLSAIGRIDSCPGNETEETSIPGFYG